MDSSNLIGPLLLNNSRYSINALSTRVQTSLVTVLANISEYVGKLN